MNVLLWVYFSEYLNHVSSVYLEYQVCHSRIQWFKPKTGVTELKLQIFTTSVKPVLFSSNKTTLQWNIHAIWSSLFKLSDHLAQEPYSVVKKALWHLNSKIYKLCNEQKKWSTKQIIIITIMTHVCGLFRGIKYQDLLTST